MIAVLQLQEPVEDKVFAMISRGSLKLEDAEHHRLCLHSFRAMVFYKRNRQYGELC